MAAPQQTPVPQSLHTLDASARDSEQLRDDDRTPSPEPQPTSPQAQAQALPPALPVLSLEEALALAQHHTVALTTSDRFACILIPSRTALNREIYEAMRPTELETPLTFAWHAVYADWEAFVQQHRTAALAARHRALVTDFSVSQVDEDTDLECLGL